METGCSGTWFDFLISRNAPRSNESYSQRVSFRTLFRIAAILVETSLFTSSSVDEIRDVKSWNTLAEGMMMGTNLEIRIQFFSPLSLDQLGE